MVAPASRAPGKGLVAMPAILTNDISIHYDQRGTGLPTLFVAGLGQDHTAWNLQMEAFAHRRCIAPDNRGAGASAAPPGPYTSWIMAADLAGLLRALELGPVDVVGLSMGGIVAQTLAELFPDHVRSMCVVGSWASTSEYQRRLFAGWASAYRRGGLELFLDVAVAASFSRRSFERPGFVDALLTAALAAERRMSPEAFEAQAGACSTYGTGVRLDRIRCPSLVVCGRHDQIAPVESSEELARLIPDAHLLIFEGSGHLPLWEETDAFNAALLEFWAQVEG